MPRSLYCTKIKPWSERRESNPYWQFGKLSFLPLNYSRTLSFLRKLGRGSKIRTYAVSPSKGDAFTILGYSPYNCPSAVCFRFTTVNDWQRIINPWRASFRPSPLKTVWRCFISQSELLLGLPWFLLIDANCLSLNQPLLSQTTAPTTPRNRYLLRLFRAYRSSTLHQQRRPFLSALFSKATPLPSTPLLYHTFFILSIIAPLFYCHFIAIFPLITHFQNYLLWKADKRFSRLETSKIGRKPTPGRLQKLCKFPCICQYV